MLCAFGKFEVRRKKTKTYEKYAPQSKQQKGQANCLPSSGFAKFHRTVAFVALLLCGDRRGVRRETLATPTPRGGPQHKKKTFEDAPD